MKTLNEFLDESLLNEILDNPYPYKNTAKTSEYVVEYTFYSEVQRKEIRKSFQKGVAMCPPK